MEIILLLGYVPLVAYLFWQSYLLAQHRKLVDDQQEQIKKLKPFQFRVATLWGGNSPHARKPNVSGRVYNSIIKKEEN